jgi:GAF domain-containing protein
MKEQQSSHSGDAAVRRERSLVEMFVLLADTLVEDYDVVDLLDRLVTTAVDLLGVTAAGLLLADQQGHLDVVASSSEGTRLLEIFQLQSQQGPCFDCVKGSASVSSIDLAADHDRWPVFVPAALAAGFAAVLAVPMRLRKQTIGALNLFSAAPGLLPAEDVAIAQGLADVATIGILQQRSTDRSSALAQQLQSALNSRVVIEQAKGVLSERHGMGMDSAFEALRKQARDRNLKLGDLAQQLVRGDGDELP